MRVDLDALRDELHVESRTLRAAIEQTNVHMRLLHEEVVDRLERMGERWSAAMPPRKKR